LLLSLPLLLLCMSPLSLAPQSSTNNCVICYLACREENMEKRENANFLLPVSLGFVRSAAMILLFTLPNLAVEVIFTHCSYSCTIHLLLEMLVYIFFTFFLICY
jgi:hypothetical protein